MLLRPVMRNRKPGKGALHSRSRVSSASEGQDLVRSLALSAAVAQRPWLCSQAEQAGSRGQRWRPRRRAVLLSFWWCAKTAAGEAANFWPARLSGYLCGEWRTNSIPGG